MTTESLIQILELLLAAALLVWFFRGPWQSVLVDITRQRLFEVRESIFLYAADGRMDFNSKAYRDIRDRLNSSIRFCHKAKFSSLVAAIAVQEGGIRPSRPLPLLEIISEIEDVELRRDLEEKAIEMVGFLATLMVLRSPFLLILSMLLMPFFLVYELLSGHVKRLLACVGSIIERDIALDDRRWV